MNKIILISTSVLSQKTREFVSNGDSKQLKNAIHTPLDKYILLESYAGMHTLTFYKKKKLKKKIKKWLSLKKKKEKKKIISKMKKTLHEINLGVFEDDILSAWNHETNDLMRFLGFCRYRKNKKRYTLEFQMFFEKVLIEEF